MVIIGDCRSPVEGSIPSVSAIILALALLIPFPAQGHGQDFKKHMREHQKDTRGTDRRHREMRRLHRELLRQLIIPRTVWEYEGKTFHEHAPDGHFHSDGKWSVGSHHGRTGKHYHH